MIRSALVKMGGHGKLRALSCGLSALLLAVGCTVSKRNGHKLAEASGGSAGAGAVSGAATLVGSGGAAQAGAVGSGGATGMGGAPSMGGAAAAGAGTAGTTTLSGSGGSSGGAASALGGSGPGGKPGVGGTAGANAGSAGAALDLCGQQLLRNADFEQGSAEWLLESDFPGVSAIVRSNDPALRAEGVLPKAGDFLAWLGGIPDNRFESYYVSISQVVHLPAGTSSLTLTGFVRIKTEEPDVNDTYDRGLIQLEYPDDRPDLLWLPVEWTVDQANGDWVQFSAVKMDTAAIAGQDVMLRARAETDPSLKTSFWLDSLSLVAKCGR